MPGTRSISAPATSFRQLQLLAGSSYGVSWLDNYSLMNELPNQNGASAQRPNLDARFNTGREVYGPGEHPFATKYAVRSPQIRIEPSIYLEALMRDFVLFGGHIVMRKFDTPRDLMSLSEPVVFNCTGLGARDLFGDQELIPLKGQLTVMVPQPEVQYHTNGGDAGTRDARHPHDGAQRGIILGGTRSAHLDEPDEAGASASSTAHRGVCDESAQV